MQFSRTILLVFFSVALITLRVLYTESHAYVFLLWNLFLAWLPLFFAIRHQLANKPIVKLLYLALMLLFIPNAPYLVTDLFHLKKQSEAPQWFDTVMLSSFSLLGILYFIQASAYLIAAAGSWLKAKVQLLAFKIVLMLLCGYGIYLGRYLRFNSWDIIAQPADLLHAIFTSVAHKNHLKETGAITLCFAGFLFILYESLGKKIETTPICFKETERL